MIAKYLHQDVVLMHIDGTLVVTPFDDSSSYNLEYDELGQYSKSRRGGQFISYFKLAPTILPLSLTRVV